MHSITGCMLERKIKVYIWKPKRDITIFELAKCIRFVTKPICKDPSLIAPDCMRHFEMILI